MTVDAKTQSAEVGFKEALQDVIPIIEKLSIHCKTFDEMLSMVKLALSDEGSGQLRLLMSIVLATNKK